MYNVKGFVDKNRDVHQEVFLDLLTSSKKIFVQNLTGLPNQVIHYQFRQFIYEIYKQIQRYKNF